MSRANGKRRPAVLFGGAGFIGSNLADHLLSGGVPVRVVDSLARPGVERNLEWLKARHGSLLEVVKGDVRDPVAVRRAVRDAREVFNFAAQVAVTTSLLGPVHDFEVNARGTLNVLEALRELDEPPPLVFTSTNKVYGALADVPLVRVGERYAPADPRLAEAGLSEARSLDFESPYGCSKGAADQYVLDYARSFGLRTVVFRMSCIYGPRQFGNEDQGWVAHFLLAAEEGRTLTIFGDGRQVRDILYVGDLVQALVTAREQVERISGQAFNIGGGPERSVSLLELLSRMEGLIGHPPERLFEGARTGDQRYYVSDTRKFQAATGWAPRVGVDEGLRRLHAWVRGIKQQHPAAARRGEEGRGPLAAQR